MYTREMVLVIPKEDVHPCFEGILMITPKDAESFLRNAHWQHKLEAEGDFTRKQAVAVSVIINPESQQVFVYQRPNTTSYAEERLRGRVGLTVGGHTNQTDLLVSMNTDSRMEIIEKALDRELGEEIIFDPPPKGNLSIQKQFIGLLNSQTEDVSKVHLGFLWVIRINGLARRNGSDEMKSGSMMTVKEIRSSVSFESIESWGLHILLLLPTLFKQLS